MIPTLLTFIVALLCILLWQIHKIINNQRAQIKQEFHSNGIALVSLFENEGLNHLNTITDVNKLSHKENFATGLLIQRFIAAYWIRRVFTPEEWNEMVIKDGQQVMRSELLRSRWQVVKEWYPQDIQDFVDHTLISQAGQHASSSLT